MCVFVCSVWHFDFPDLLCYSLLNKLHVPLYIQHNDFRANNNIKATGSFNLFIRLDLSLYSAPIYNVGLHMVLRLLKKHLSDCQGCWSMTLRGLFVNG